MPLGFFGSNSNNGPKPQPLTSEKEKKYKDVASTSAGVEIKDCKGSTIKLGKKTYVVERKLAEGGYAIVYLVCDKHSRCYALKRQLIRDDPRQVEACKTESQIVKNLNHPNIVGYVDHSLTVNKMGVYDYMLLTFYYKSNVLQLMNNYLKQNRFFNTDEILAIFCDVCEAVARLHHSKTPVIHRDLKIENILVDERTGTERQLYILCDFGSATTKVMSRETHTQSQLEEEIKIYTTLSYRAPEMIDLFSNTPIGTKADIWALGILLYKLCYFQLPFGESALAIQSGNFTFPDTPFISNEIKAIISKIIRLLKSISCLDLLLTNSAKHRPTIYQVAYLAFSAAKRKCPVYNIEVIKHEVFIQVYFQKSPRIELTEAVEILRLRDKLGSNYAKRFEKALNEFEETKNREKIANATAKTVTQLADSTTISKPSLSNLKHETARTESQDREAATKTTKYEEMIGVIVNTADEKQSTLTTSVNPRLRPKASSNVSGFIPPPVTAVSLIDPNSHLFFQSPRVGAKFSDDHLSSNSAQRQELNREQSPKNSPSAATSDLVSIKLTTSTQRENVSEQMKMSQISTDSSKSVPSTTETNQEPIQRTVQAENKWNFVENVEIPPISRPRNAATLPATALRSSAFHKRFDEKTTCTAVKSPSSDAITHERLTTVESSNPFVACSTMDDNDFGEHFDQLPRGLNRRNTVVPAIPPKVVRKEELRLEEVNFELDSLLEQAIEEDPFGSAPILPSQMYTPKTVNNI
ncbi:Kinase domain protein [Aphelenchoides besseyi]|nr:Kinase domain protein [Aphelenchoides besseyi]